MRVCISGRMGVLLRTEQSRMNAKTLTIASAFVAFMMVAGPVSAQAPDAAAPAATAPAGDAAAAPGGVTPPTANVKNPYGLQALWETGDFVSHGVLGLLAV